MLAEKEIFQFLYYKKGIIGSTLIMYLSIIKTNLRFKNGLTRLNFIKKTNNIIRESNKYERCNYNIHFEITSTINTIVEEDLIVQIYSIS